MLDMCADHLIVTVKRLESVKRKQRNLLKNKSSSSRSISNTILFHCRINSAARVWDLEIYGSHP